MHPTIVFRIPKDWSMKKSLHSLGGFLAASLLGATLALPAVAQAGCPSYGNQGMSGDCSPRSSQCFNSWVTDHRMFSGVWHYKLLVYRRNAGGTWSYYSETWHPC
ncbi:hypothetical protein [Lysobacter sp. TY2-98]|uniref:hypothetical protein n=1 Tax=Lysobacter sp. TY2-98 TaxID=2290922 RepID=UPI0013B3D710|nr:hypothetical protein [Lysobacter sp. TY2-98]